MSSEIFYDKAFILVGEKYIPVANHGSSNCFDIGRGGREIPEKYWSVLNYSHKDKMLFTADEMKEIAETYEAVSVNNYGGTRKSRYRPFEAGEFQCWILSGMKSAHTVEDYGKYGNTVVVVDYDDERWKRHSVATTDELLKKLQELAGHAFTVAFLDDRHVTHPPVRSRVKRKRTDFSELPEYYVLRAVHGYFVKRSSRRIWFAGNQKPQESQIRKFRSEKAARKYLDDNQKSFSNYTFEIECVKNENTAV